MRGRRTDHFHDGVWQLNDTDVIAVIGSLSRRQPAIHVRDVPSLIRYTTDQQRSNPNHEELLHRTGYPICRVGFGLYGPSLASGLGYPTPDGRKIGRT